MVSIFFASGHILSCWFLDIMLISTLRVSINISSINQQLRIWRLSEKNTHHPLLNYVIKKLLHKTKKVNMKALSPSYQPMSTSLKNIRTMRKNTNLSLLLLFRNMSSSLYLFLCIYDYLLVGIYSFIGATSNWSYKI